MNTMHFGWTGRDEHRKACYGDLPLVVILMVLSMWSFPSNEVQRLELLWKERLVDHSDLDCMLLTTWIDA